MQVERGSWREQSCRGSSGGRVSNTWVTCPRDRDTPSKGGLILDTLSRSCDLESVSSISPPFEGVSRSRGQVSHVFLTRPPLEPRHDCSRHDPRSTCMC